ncbi:MAG: DNA replication/repair protein RecF [Pseudobdellovibrionaceae bacterium]|nr:DNA replication/repair protein RecF [Bdellovibrionales bacterium]USN46844.1 MAG: DNA replication/repair protein RecF [Pseudobdellovibrionaceae bacterium]
MWLKRLRLSHFRNYSDQTVDFHQRVNILIGANGQGKTNLLEAIYLLGRGGTFRPGRNDKLVDRDCIGPVHAVLKASLQQGELSSVAEVNISPTSKTISLNGKKVSTAVLIRKNPVILFCPESLAAIKSGPDERRTLIDEVLITHSPENSQLLSDFRRILRQRNRLLRDLKQGSIEQREGLALLDSINCTYFPLASQLTWSRISALRAIQPDLQNAMRTISGLNEVDVSVDYVISGQSAIDWDENQVYDALISRLQQLSRAEAEAGLSLVGPHKHDISFLYDKEDSRFFCSQGQQRALVLSFKMAQVMYHYRHYKDYPLLLLDDVLSELDQDKRGNLVKFLQGIKAQIFLTTTDLSLPEDFKDTDLALFSVNSGRVQQVS